MTLDPDFLYPEFDDCPITYFCKNLLYVIDKYQVKWFKFQNYKWANILNCTLQKIDSKALMVGQPTTANTRGLYCFGLGVQGQPTTDDRLNYTLILTYSTGKAQLSGVAASIYGDLIESGFYLHAINSLIKRLQDSNRISAELTYNWPKENPFYDQAGQVAVTSESDPPEIVVTTSNLNPDSQITNPSLGVQASLQVNLVVSPNIIKKPY